MNHNTPTRIVPAVNNKRAERRRARRVAPGRMTPCLVEPGGRDEAFSGWVHNLSVRGAGLLSARPFAADELLTVLFINAAHTFALSARVRVVRCYRAVGGDYFLGVEFAEPLRYDEMLPFIS